MGYFLPKKCNKMRSLFRKVKSIIKINLGRDWIRAQVLLQRGRVWVRAQVLLECGWIWAWIHLLGGWVRTLLFLLGRGSHYYKITLCTQGQSSRHHLIPHLNTPEIPYVPRDSLQVHHVSSHLNHQKLPDVPRDSPEVHYTVLSLGTLAPVDFEI